MKPRLLKFTSLISGILGVGILLYVLIPLFSYQISARKEYPTLLSPLSDIASSRQGGDFKVSDFTKASNWFEDGKDQSDYNLPKVTHYTLTIPTLGIKDAVASIGGEDLAESLIQYPGTALPGKIGNAVIFGHSILPIFYDPKNYLSIFSTLPSIDTGDGIYINFDGVEYSYIVEEKFEVRPTDIQILEQDKSDSFLTLVTCTPPGDPRRPKRLIIRAKIVPNGTKLTNANTWN